MASAAVLCLGTELTRGELVNTNAAWLAEALTRAGFEVTAVDAVDDHEGRIARAVERLGQEHDVLVCTGGLGPTTDDVTTAAVASLLGVPLERDAGALEAIRERFRRFGRQMSPSNEKQADLPRGASLLPNPRGTAPGFALGVGRARAFFLPGVPAEMTAMFEESVEPAIRSLVDVAHQQVLLRSYGLPESEVNDRLDGLAAAFDVELGYRATFPVIEVKVLARAADRTTAEQRARAGADEVRRRLGDIVFGEGTASFAETVGRAFVERGLRLACAESCTGGLVAELLTARPGASAFFAGGAVVYENSAKSALLGVDPALIASHGAVSAEVARAMAEGARARFATEVALAITGIAGPDGGSDEKPVGLIHYAVATAAGVSERRRVFVGDRGRVRLGAAYAALALVRRVVREGHDDGEAGA